MTESFAALLDAAARRRPDAPALVWDGGALTWRELDLRAGGLARRLSRQGVRAGDTVALLLPNGWGFVAALWGALKLGATVAPLNPLLAAGERDRILAHLGPALIVDEVGEEEVREEEAVTDSADGKAPALILYTSGSAGRPKGAVLSHAALSKANASWAGPVMRLTPQDVVLAALPLAHSFGLNGALLAPLLAGATVAIQERFSPEETLRAIARHGVTVLPAVATMFQRMLEVPGVSEAACSSLRLAVSGAAPCPWELSQAWRRRTGVRIVRGYGMTELFRPISYLADDATDLPDAIGRPVPGVEARVVDPEGQTLAPGEAGELWIRTPAAMDGYFRAEEETRAVIQDGWFKTGDLATISPEGFVSVVGRKKDLILRGGYSVVPGEVEAALLDHPAVAEAAVIGTPHPELGEEVAAFVTLRPGARADADELVAFCRERLAAFKYPRSVTLVGELPKSATGKVLKWRLGVTKPG
ncbi:MAG: AMP-binding protein [Candidatus Rokubacteria bacterium]|nr:AMP-binding protein [Candidatus Rokubacteria bacterium]